MPSSDVSCLITKKEVHKQFRARVGWIPVIWHHTQGRIWIRSSADRYSAWTRQKTTLFSDHYLRNRSTLDIGILGYIGILKHKEHPPEIWRIPPGTPCIPLLSVQWINSWWWTDELCETCRVSCQNKFVKLVHLVGFITQKFVTMHGHMNVKNRNMLLSIYLLFSRKE